MIEQWLQKFRSSWIAHDIDGVLSLFDTGVEYWETPFQKLMGLNDVRDEWSTIDKQSDIELNTSIFSEQGNQSAIKWGLTYTNESNEQKYWSGVYLIRLNEIGKCVYFLQVGEQQA